MSTLLERFIELYHDMGLTPDSSSEDGGIKALIDQDGLEFVRKEG